VAYGGGIFSSSNGLGLRYLTNLLFINNEVTESLGNDIADSSTNPLSFYSPESVTNCQSTSLPVKFYHVNRSLVLDCILMGFFMIYYIFIYFFLNTQQMIALLIISMYNQLEVTFHFVVHFLALAVIWFYNFFFFVSFFFFE
jgi:hypothetical protein